MSKCPFCGTLTARTWGRSAGAFTYCTACRVALRSPEQTHDASDYHAAIRSEPDWDAETPSVVLSAYARFVKRCLRPNGAVLDFGTGTGGFVRALRAEGLGAYGVEPSATARDAAGRLHGLRIAPSLSDLPPVRWSGATAIEVAEHIANPKWLETLYEVLAPGAFLFVTTPNRDSLAAQLAGTDWPQMTNPFHAVLFNANALRGVMERAGFVNVHLLRSGPTQGRTAGHRMAHAALLLAGRHSSLRMVGFKPAPGATCE